MKKKKISGYVFSVGTNNIISERGSASKKLSEQELQNIERFRSGILIEIDAFKISLEIYIKDLPDSDLKSCCEDMLSIWNALPAILKNNLLAGIVLGSQKISEKRLLLPGFGGCHIENGFFTTLVVETRAFLQLTEMIEEKIEKMNLQEVYRKLEKIHELFIPSLNT